jgi:anti-sigma B factor antagonist
VTPRGDQLASVTRYEQDGVTVATLQGEIDVSNAAQIGRELTEVPNHSLGLVADLRAVRYLDSTAIALLYELHVRLERRGQGLAVVAPADGAPRRVLELTAFETRAPLADDLKAAVDAVRRGVARGSPPD